MTTIVDVLVLDGLSLGRRVQVHVGLFAQLDALLQMGQTLVKILDYQSSYLFYYLYLGHEAL